MNIAPINVNFKSAGRDYFKPKPPQAPSAPLQAPIKANQPNSIQEHEARLNTLEAKRKTLSVLTKALDTEIIKERKVLMNALEAQELAKIERYEHNGAPNE